MITQAQEVDPVPEVKPLERVDGDDRKIVTVFLDNTSPQFRKNLHCPNCGRIVCNYYSEARIIIFGEITQVSRPHDIQCSRCKTLVRIA